MKTITISAQGITVKAEMNNSPTAQAIFKALPIEGLANRWGNEIYFEIPVVMPQEPEAHADVEAGELGYWPVGHAFCIFFGPTPASSDDHPRAASPVNVFGRVIGDAKSLKKVKEGAVIRVA